MKFSQEVFFDLLREKVGAKNDAELAEWLGMTRHHYSQYATGRNQLKLAATLDWFDILGLNSKDLLNLIEESKMPVKKTPVRLRVS